LAEVIQRDGANDVVEQDQSFSRASLSLEAEKLQKENVCQFA
jgi:hypothetical protein